VTTISDENDLQQLAAGDLVQVSGEVRGNPLQEVLDLFERLAPYMGIDLANRSCSDPNHRRSCSLSAVCNC
jgi:hypothetical protein